MISRWDRVLISVLMVLAGPFMWGVHPFLGVGYALAGLYLFYYTVKSR